MLLDDTLGYNTHSIGSRNVNTFEGWQALQMCFWEVIEMSWGPYQKCIILRRVSQRDRVSADGGSLSHAAYVQLLPVPMTSGALAWQGCGKGGEGTVFIPM